MFSLTIISVTVPIEVFHDSFTFILVSKNNKSRTFLYLIEFVLQIDVVRQIPHDGQVYRARHMPQDPFIIATKTSSSEVNIFDYRNHPAEPPIGGTSRPDLRLTGHRSEGYGLSWSTINRGFLLSGSDDGRICLWDVNRAPLNKASIGASEMFKVHFISILDIG